MYGPEGYFDRHDPSYPRQEGSELNVDDPFHFRKNRSWSLEEMEAKAVIHVEARPKVDMLSFLMPYHDSSHDEVDDLLKELGPEVFQPPFGWFSPLISACTIECMTCVDLCIKYQLNTPEALSQVKWALSTPNQENEMKRNRENQLACYHYLLRRAPIHPVNLGRILPLLVCFIRINPVMSSILSPILRHHTFTVDPFRHVFKLALTSQRLKTL
jgi:hypothetical protein